MTFYWKSFRAIRITFNPTNKSAAIPQEIREKVGRFGLDLPHGRDEKEKHKSSNCFEPEFSEAVLQLHS